MGYLAQNSNGRHVLIDELASAGKIPKKYLEVILLTLRKGGLLTSRIGRGGGYRLSHDPSAITIGNIVRILEGDFTLVHCLKGNGTAQCEDGNNPLCCGIHLVMLDVKKKITSVFEATTLADIINKSEAANKSKAKGKSQGD